MANIIKRLEAHVANQIAAGEVVQRPASVVKELLENAIDAGATKIDLTLKDSGKTLIQVVDNGRGMNSQDALLAFERHATSKLSSSEDLFHITTKGFRGEALASIAAIAQVVLKTKSEESELGLQVEIEGGVLKNQEEIVASQGSLFSVKNLFYNIPARRNFLKSDRIELNHCIDEFHRVAMVHTQIEFSFSSNDVKLFHLTPTNSRQRIVQIFGTKMNDKLVPVNEETPLVKVSGFVLKPEQAKKSRGTQFFFVNDRYIKSPFLNNAVQSAFEGLIHTGTYPGYFIELQVDPSSIDINIHPTKTEVKFDDDHTLYAVIRSAIKHSLGQFNVAPSLDFDLDPNLQTPYHYQGKEATLPKVSVDRSFNPFAEESPAKSYSPNSIRNKEASWEALYTGLKEPVETSEYQSHESEKALFEESDELTASIHCFQLDKKYIVTKIKSGMVVIHQSRAHQRVLYERFLTQITIKEGSSQQLLFPITLNFIAPEIQMLQELEPSLHRVGFHFEIYNEEVILRGVPVLIETQEAEKCLEEFIHTYSTAVDSESFSQNDVLSKALAKTIGIKTGTFLSEIEQIGLVHDLFACREPQLSPSLKATYTTITATDLSTKYF